MTRVDFEVTDQGREEKLDELREHLKDATNNRKTSVAATVRMAIDMAYSRKNELEHERSYVYDQFNYLQGELERHAEDV